MKTLKIVPELCCQDLEQSLDFYINTLGFSMLYQRAQDKFAYLTLNGVDLMLEELNDSRWLTGDMQKPYGRGINFQFDVEDVEALYQKVVTSSPQSIYLKLETQIYQCGEYEARQKQCIIQDPNGYLFRFCQSI